MAEPISIQQLKDASLDAKTLEEAVNGDSVTTVLSRLGETYPTLSNALNQIDSKLDSADTQIKQGITNLFENGGLPATPFETKALMEASILVDGDYAVVTDDSVGSNNGYYQKKSGTWSYVKFNNKGSNRTMYYFQGSYTAVAPTGNGDVRVGAEISQNTVRVADVSGATEAVVEFKRMQEGFERTAVYIKVFFYGSPDITPTGYNTDPKVVAEREIAWFTDEDLRTVFDVRDYAGMLVVLQIRPQHLLTGENIEFNFMSTPFKTDVTNKALMEGVVKGASKDIAIGQDKISTVNVPIADVRDFNTVHLEIKPITGCLTPIILRVLYFKKPTGLVTLQGNLSLIHGHEKYTEVDWGKPATEPLSVSFDVSGYAGFLVLLQLRPTHGVVGADIPVRMWADNSSAVVPAKSGGNIVEKRVTFSANSLFTELTAKRAISIESLPEGMRDISIWVATEFPIPMTIEMYDKRTSSTKPVMVWDGEKFVPKTYGNRITLPAAVNNLDVFDVTNAFKFDHGTTFDFRAQATRDATSEDEKNLNGSPRTITFIIRGFV